MSQKTVFTCDVVVDQEQYREHGTGQCNQPAMLNRNKLPVGFCIAKNHYNVCAEHGNLSLVDLLKNVGEIK